jgi:signal transduction histidine kinase
VERSGVSRDAGAARWLSVHDDLLRGLAHAFSNRVATVSAIAALFDPARLPDERVLAGLRTDADRLDGLLEQLRQLPRRGDADIEPLMPGDCVRTALALFEHHPEYRDVRFTVVAGDDMQPVRTDPAALQHALCVALSAACRIGAGGGAGSGSAAAVRLALTVEGDVVRIEVSADGSTGEGDEAELALDAGAIDWLLATSNGRGHAYPYGCLIELPTLQASRRPR